MPLPSRLVSIHLSPSPNLAVVVCAALPARTIQNFVILAQAAGYDVWLIPTPNALAFMDLPLLTNLTAHPIISSYPGSEEHLPAFDAVVVTPATLNTIKKWAHCVPDTFALHFLLQSEQSHLPILVIPRVSSDLAQDPVFLPALVLLRSRGISIYYKPDRYPPNNNLPWSVMVELLQDLYRSRKDVFMPGCDNLHLVKPLPQFAALYQDMIREFMQTGEGWFNNFPLALENFPDFVHELQDEELGIGLPPGIVPQQTYWLLQQDNILLGEIRLRPHLTEPFERHNGHIGYNIRPSQRGKGYASCQLRLLLPIAKEQGLERVMLTIDGVNPASVRVIEKNGGKLDWQRTTASGEILSCYWIEL